MTHDFTQQDGRHDFDFFMGSWAVHHKRLRERLKGSTDWEEFDGTCVARPLPGVLGNEGSLIEESFDGGLLEQAHYTRPQTWEVRDIPAILTSGDHAKVEAWRKAERERLTRERRPELLPNPKAPPNKSR